MYYINRWAVWIMRAFHCRGFGVQSPSDYSFIRYVVNEHYPYYAYSELAAAMPQAGRLTHKMGRLYLRMANYRQPRVIVYAGQQNAAYKAYMQAGCKRAVIADSIGQAIARQTHIDMLIVRLDDSSEDVIVSALEHVDSRSVFVIEGINRNKAARAFWQRVIKDERIRVTFDLYYAGVLFFDVRRYKQHYKVNF